jgi:signal peptidase I
VPFAWVVALALSVVLGACGSESHPSSALTKTYRVPSETMEPTISVGDHVSVTLTGARGIRVGDIVVFHPPRGAQTGACGVMPARGEMCARPTGGPVDISFIKRVVAGPRDTIALRAGHVLRNGLPASEPFARTCDSSEPCTFTQAIRIPADHWFMLGDNRGASDDSRFWGPVPGQWIVGRVVKTLPRGAQD